MCMPCLFGCLWRPEECASPSGAGVTAGFDPTDVSGRKRTLVLCTRSNHSLLLSHLSRPSHLLIKIVLFLIVCIYVYKY